MDLSGNVETLAAVSMARAPRFSPDVRYVAYEVESLSEATADDIWVWDRVRSVPTRVTFEDDNSLPEWSPDGSRLFYDTPQSILSRAADGSGESELVQPAAGVTPPYITPDGAWLLWTQPGNGALDVWIRPLDGSAEAKPLLQSAFGEVSPAVSPDGRWIAYMSDASGQPEIYVEPFPTLGSRFKVTTGGAWEPLWAPDGSRLYFRTRATNGFGVSAVDVRGGERFDVGPPTELFQVDNLRSVGTATNYDLSPDGTHFVFVRGSGAGSAREAAQVVITNALNQGRAGGE